MIADFPHLQQYLSFGPQETPGSRACDGDEAIHVVDHHRRVIHLLLSDIVMGGRLSGLQLAEILTAVRPDMCVLLMSVLTTSDPYPGMDGIPAKFVSKVKEVLEQPMRRQACARIM